MYPKANAFRLPRSPAPSASQAPRVTQLLLAPVYYKVEPLPAKFRCPCCGYRTLEAPGTLALCPVCWWEDDGQEDDDALDVRLTVNGDLSLNEARLSFAQCGAAHPRFLPYVRPPFLTEK